MYPFKFSFDNPEGTSEEERRKKLFGNINFEDTTPDEGVMNTEPVHPQQSIMDAYKEIMNRRDGPNMSAFKQYLNRGYPTEENYKPSKLRTLGAILSGAATGFAEGPTRGMKAAEETLDEPYNKALLRYKNEGQRLQSAAALEESTYRNKLGAVKDVASMQHQQDELERQNKLADSTIALNAARQRAAGKSIQKADDGHVYSIDTSTGNKTDLGKLNASNSEKFQQDLEKFSIEEKTRQANRERGLNITFGNQKALEGMRETAAGGRQDKSIQAAKELEDIRNKNRVAAQKTRNEEIRGRITLRTDEAIRKDNALKGIKGEDNVKRIKQNIPNVMAIYDTDPGKYSKYFDESNFNMKNPPDINSPEYEDYRTLYNLLYANTGHSLGKPMDPRIILDKR